ncbi:MAG: hypothetical protein J0M18_06920 [Ignavibacteria bacterium]|nr:hypothetical protein [Ignavibacteria bacterium]
MTSESENEKEYLEFFKKLLDQLIYVNNIFEIYKHIQNKRVDKLSELNFAPTFFGLVLESLFSDTIVTLCKIYKNGKNDEYNIHTFLELIEKNVILFSWEKRFSRSTFKEQDIEYYKKLHNRVDLDIISKHREQIKQKHKSVESLFFWRDKHFAHNDKKYFLSSDLIAKDSPITYGEIKELIELVQDIMNYYSVAFNGCSNSINYMGQFDIDKILDALTEYKKMKKDDWNRKYKNYRSDK